MNQIFEGSIKQGRNLIQLTLDIIIFKEDESTIVYCPPLDLAGYGTSETGARKSFKTVLSEYFRYTLNKATLREDLQRMGWKVKSTRKPMTPPSLDKILRNNENFNRIFNNFDFKKTVTQVEIPELVL